MAIIFVLVFFKEDNTDKNFSDIPLKKGKLHEDSVTFKEHTTSF